MQAIQAKLDDRERVSWKQLPRDPGKSHDYETVIKTKEPKKQEKKMRIAHYNRSDLLI